MVSQGQLALPPFQDLSMDNPNIHELLGPLFDFVGKWTNEPGQGWNLIAVPGATKDTPGFPVYFDSNHGFILETIPYIETTTYQPISVTLNRGQFTQSNPPGTQQIQQIGALLYEQRISSAGVDPSNKNYKEITAFFEARGFSKGTPIHAEQGMLLNLTNFQSWGSQNLQVARLGTIPHGNVILCLGDSTAQKSPEINPNALSVMPTAVDPSRQLPLEYTINTYAPPDHTNESYPFYPQFIPSSPLATLIAANKGTTFSSTQHISLSTQNGTGGILNLPFVGGGFDGTQIKTTTMTVDYWISRLGGGGGNRGSSPAIRSEHRSCFPIGAGPVTTNQLATHRTEYDV